MRSKLILSAAAVLFGAAVFAQAPSDGPSARWKVSVEETGDGGSKIVYTATISPGLHIYGLNPEIGNPVEVEYSEADLSFLDGPFEEESEPEIYKDDRVFFKKAVFSQKISSNAPSTVSGTITWQACEDESCYPPEDQEFNVKVSSPATAVPESVPASDKSGKGIWALILEAILWGFAMLLTPCVFPMVPMTVSFFLKGSGSPAKGRFNAFMYGLFIVLLYTVPICIIIGLTWIVGGETVTADIFNWLATHWLPNIIFFIVFMVFALSFFGAFEITLPSSWLNASDSKTGKKGLGGVFFMALTLVLVSFSCTGPIVGTVLIQSTQGEIWTPMVTMLAFSVAFALPFTLLALFPSLLKNMKSGGWLSRVKAVLGFIELALGLKFLSVADQTYHWGILDRPVYLALWIAIFTLLALYLLGVFRFKQDEDEGHVSIVRLILATGVLAFVIYLVPGMFGAPLKAISGYLPPMETQDFVLGANAKPIEANLSPGKDIKLPLNLQGYLSVDEGLEEAKRTGKPVFLDITGHGCVNCREMEARVWSDPEVLSRLKDDFVFVALYNDDKTRLPEDQWVRTESGKVLKDVGRVNSYIARTRFGVNAQPNYFILSPEGEILAGPRGYNLDIPGFIEFLDSAK